MIGDELKYHILQAFDHVPTREQEQALRVFVDFMTSRDSQTVMVLRGSAGTGKTTLAGAIVRGMKALKMKMVLLAPTGRAAKVFSLYAGSPAYTIHRRIYRQRSMMGGFELNFNSAHDTLFIVDEASMIANGESPLLDDLIHFVYQKDCRLLLIGDNAQLPPVGETESPALQSGVLRGYGLDVFESNLVEVLRQSQESGILFNATRIRDLSRCEVRGTRYENSPETESSGVQGNLVPRTSHLVPRIRLQGFTDIQVVPGDELIESLSTSYSRAGLDDTIVVTRSNKRANVYNLGIRRTILDREDELCRGDRLMIVKNNYFVIRGDEGTGVRGHENASTPPMTFIANGDIAVVQRVRNIHELYGFRFAEVTMSFPDYDDYELTATTLLDTLTAEAPALTREQQEQLFSKVMEDYADIPLKADRMKKLKEDRYFNALQVKFAYAVTCHKAQGGQWSHVYLDQGYMTDDMLTPDYIHWLYTAFTRATDRLFLVNWPKTQVEE